MRMNTRKRGGLRIGFCQEMEREHEEMHVRFGRRPKLSGGGESLRRFACLRAWVVCGYAKKENVDSQQSLWSVVVRSFNNFEIDTSDSPCGFVVQTVK